MHKMFAIRDAALGQFLNPFQAPSTGFALRSFQNEVQSPDSPISKNPEDFELFEIGTYDPETGLLSSISPHSVSRAKELLTKSLAA